MSKFWPFFIAWVGFSQIGFAQSILNFESNVIHPIGAFESCLLYVDGENVSLETKGVSNHGVSYQANLGAVTALLQHNFGKPFSTDTGSTCSLKRFSLAIEIGESEETYFVDDTTLNLELRTDRAIPDAQVFNSVLVATDRHAGVLAKIRPVNSWAAKRVRVQCGLGH